MIASNACLPKCPAAMETLRFRLAKEVAALPEDEINELIRLLIQRGIFSADEFPSARDKLKGVGI